MSSDYQSVGTSLVSWVPTKQRKLLYKCNQGASQGRLDYTEVSIVGRFWKKCNFFASALNWSSGLPPDPTRHFTPLNSILCNHIHVLLMEVASMFARLTLSFPYKKDATYYKQGRRTYSIRISFIHIIHNWSVSMAHDIHFKMVHQCRSYRIRSSYHNLRHILQLL